MLEMTGLGEAPITLTLAEADRVGSAEEVAVTVIAPGDVAGAIYVPAGHAGRAAMGQINPWSASPPATPFTDQVTP